MRYAYVTFLIKNDGYLPGALTLAYSMKRFDDIEFVCLVSEEVSANAKELLSLLFDKVVEIQSIKLKHHIKSGRQDRNELLTRFAPLLLDYDKIILLDADVLILSSINDLFEINAPAGIINECKENLISSYKNTTVINEKWNWHKVYENICSHGTVIPEFITDRPKTDNRNFGVNSALWRLDPSPKTYNDVMDALKNKETLQMFQSFPWPEMQLATVLWSGKWTSIDARYCSIGGYPNLDVLKSTHFAGLKPWSVRNKSIKLYSEYTDFKEWYSVFLQMYFSYQELRKCSALRRVEEFILYNKIL